MDSYAALLLYLLLVASLSSTAAQLDGLAQLERLKDPVPGNARDVRAVEREMAGAGRGKFHKPRSDAPVVDKEYIVTYYPKTPAAVLDEVARQLAFDAPGVQLQLLGNRSGGWRGMAFKVPPDHTPGQTAALLDRLLALPEALAGEANEFVSMYRPVPETATLPTAATAVVVEPTAAAAATAESAAEPAAVQPASVAAVVQPATVEPATAAAAVEPATAAETAAIEGAGGPAAAAVAAAALTAADALSAWPVVATKGKPAPDGASAAAATCPSYIPGTVVARSLALNAASGKVPSNGLWGLERVENRSRSYDGVYRYSSGGAGVNVFIVDTGVQPNHPELTGRVTLTYTNIYDGLGAADGNGHGTHCAGTVGGLKVGLAPSVKIHSVRVLDHKGTGTMAGVIAGIDYVATAKTIPRRIMSMSLGGDKSTGVNAAVDRAYNNGVLVVVAAGNENTDACNTSPASAANAITVAASDINDLRPSWSNHGSCVDIFAPGVDIYSSVNKNGYMMHSGTSMAAPHVAGVVARMWSKGVCNSAITCAAAVKCLATANAASYTNSRTTRALVYIPQDV